MRWEYPSTTNNRTPWERYTQNIEQYTHMLSKPTYLYLSNWAYSKGKMTRVKNSKTGTGFTEKSHWCTYEQKRETWYHHMLWWLRDSHLMILAWLQLGNPTAMRPHALLDARLAGRGASTMPEWLGMLITTPSVLEQGSTSNYNNKVLHREDPVDLGMEIIQDLTRITS